MSSDLGDPMVNVSFAVEGIALTIVAILGLIGNIALIIIFWNQINQKHVKALFISLAIFDLIFITCALLSFTTNRFFPDFYDSNVSLALPWLLPISQSALTGSVYFTIAISIGKLRNILERFTFLLHFLSREILTGVQKPKPGKVPRCCDHNSSHTFFPGLQPTPIL